jgi:hypothetical protein
MPSEVLRPRYDQLFPSWTVITKSSEGIFVLKLKPNIVKMDPTKYQKWQFHCQRTTVILHMECHRHMCPTASESSPYNGNMVNAMTSLANPRNNTDNNTDIFLVIEHLLVPCLLSAIVMSIG